MLEIADLGFHYPRRDWVFRGVTFQVPPGSATAVLGPNGNGKTTLVRCVARLLQPQEGAVSRRRAGRFRPAGPRPERSPTGYATWS